MSPPDKLDSNDGLDAIQRLVEGLTFLETPTGADWERTENELGVSLPLHYKNLLSMLGSGNFGDFVLDNPVSSSEANRLSKSKLQDYYLYYSSEVARERGISLYPDRDGYICIGSTGNSRSLLLLPEPPAHNVGNLLWLEGNTHLAFPLNMTVSRFLSDLYSGVLSAPWSEERQLIWEPGEAFFSPRPGMRPGVVVDRWKEVLEKKWPPRKYPDR